MKNLARNILLAGLVVASAVAGKHGVHKLYKFIPFSSKTVEIKWGDTYCGKTQELKKQYPGLKEIDPRIIRSYIEHINGSKKLISGYNMQFPVILL